jgi:hypothetical protein
MLFVPEEGNKAKIRKVARLSQKESIERDCFMCRTGFVPVSFQGKI